MQLQGQGRSITALSLGKQVNLLKRRWKSRARTRRSLRSRTALAALAYGPLPRILKNARNYGQITQNYVRLRATNSWCPELQITPSYVQNVILLACTFHQLPVIRMRKVAERSKFFFCWQDMLLPRVKYARIMSFRPFRSSEWRPEGPPKHENSQLFAKKSCKKWTFRDGGQTAPSEPAPRVGSGGDVLAGLLPSHSNFYHFP